MLFHPLTKCLVTRGNTFDDAGNATRLYSLDYCVTVHINKGGCTWKLSQHDLMYCPGQGCSNPGRQVAQSH